MFGLAWRKNEFIKNKENILNQGISYVKNRKASLEKEIQKLAERDKMIRPHVRDLDVNQVLDEFIKTYLGQIIDLACASEDATEFGSKSSELVSTIERHFEKKKIGKPVSNLAIDISMALFSFGSGMDHSLQFRESGARYQF